MVECAELSEDAKEHLAHTPWKQMSLAERIEIDEFLNQLRNLMSTEAMVADAENAAQTDD